MKNIVLHIKKIRKKYMWFYVLIVILVILWGLIFHLKLADYLHDIGVEIGKALAR